jgi:hypothetical protein
MMKSQIRKINPDCLSIGADKGNQRVEGVDEKRVADMAADFRPELLGTLTVSERSDGSLVVLDGNHRLTLCRRVNYQKPLNVEVFSGLSPAQEASLFLGRNNGRMPSAISKFVARVVEGDPTAVAIDRLIQDHGWVVSVQNDDGVIAAVQAFERVYRLGHDVADKTLGIITEAWERDRKSSDSFMLAGVGALVHRWGDKLDRDKLVHEMSLTRPTVLIGRAKTLRDVQGGTVGAAMAKVLVGLHNNRKRSNLLPEWVWTR